jgi:hypothetical protein
MRVNSSSLRISIEDHSTGESVYSTSIDTSVLRDNEFKEVKLPNIPVESGRRYAIAFSSVDADAENAVAIWAGTSGRIPEGSYVEIDGARVEHSFGLAIRVYGR